jgi:hypothetical protein
MAVALNCDRTSQDSVYWVCNNELPAWAQPGSSVARSDRAPQLQSNWSIQQRLKICKWTPTGHYQAVIDHCDPANEVDRSIFRTLICYVIDKVVQVALLVDVIVLRFLVENT